MGESIVREVARRVRARIEAETREQIAKEIEAIQISKPTMETHFGYITAITEAAAIARGKV